MRRRLRRAHQRRPFALDSPPGPRPPYQPRTPRRVRLRPRHRGWRRHSRADAGSVSAQDGELPAAVGRCVWRGADFPAARPQGPGSAARARPPHCRGRGTRRARLAAGADRPVEDWQERGGGGAGVRAAVRVLCRHRLTNDRAGLRAPALHCPQAHRARAGDVEPGSGAPQELLHRQPVGEHAHLQGHAHGHADRGHVPRPVGPRLRLGAGPRAPALLDQHVPVVAARASLSLRRAQRRDQHPARQRQLDEGARRPAQVERVRRRPPEGAAGDLAGRQRHGNLRQRARVPGDGRAHAAACGVDDDPRAVGRQSRHGPGGAGVLRVPRRR